MLTFFGLLIVLAVGGYFVQEGFTDASGNKDIPGNTLTLSLVDLMSLFTKTTGSSSESSSELSSSSRPSGYRPDYRSTSELSSADKSYIDSQFKSLKEEIAKDVRATVRGQLQEQEAGLVMNDTCIDSIANQQGTDWMRYIPGKNPADYIRKDSIPCWGCSV